MPIIKSAKKKLRKDKKRTAQNEGIKNTLRDTIKKARKSPTDKTVKAAVSLADKAAKRHILHKNKAAHIKAVLSKLLVSQKKTKTDENNKPVALKTTKKTPIKK